MIFFNPLCAKNALFLYKWSNINELLLVIGDNTLNCAKYLLTCLCAYQSLFSLSCGHYVQEFFNFFFFKRFNSIYYVFIFIHFCLKLCNDEKDDDRVSYHRYVCPIIISNHRLYSLFNYDYLIKKESKLPRSVDTRRTEPPWTISDQFER